MPFNPSNPNQRKAFFAKKNKVAGSPTKPPAEVPFNISPTTSLMPSEPIAGKMKEPGLPKAPRFARVKRIFKI